MTSTGFANVGGPSGSAHATHQATPATTQGSNDGTAALLELFRQELEKNRQETKQMLNALEQRVSASSSSAQRPSQEDIARRKAIAESRWARQTEQQRISAYMDQGFDEETAMDMASEPLKDQATTIVSQPQPRRFDFKVSHFGQFDGNPDTFHHWANKIRQQWQRKSDPQYREPLLDTIPLCLVGAASNWYASLSEDELEKLNSWEAWYSAMAIAFAPDEMALEEAALSRAWEYNKESVSDYYFDKKRMLVSAFPDQTERALVHNIWKGLPTSFRLLIRNIHAHHPETRHLLREMKLLEETWRAEATNRKRQGANLKAGLSSGIGSASQQTNTSRITASSSKTSATPTPDTTSQAMVPRKSLRDTYRKNNISYQGKTRIYHVPDSDRVLKAERPCKHCGQDHFDFEHDLMSTPKFKKEAHFLEGYQVYSALMDESVFADPDSSFDSSGTGSSSSDAIDIDDREDSPMTLAGN